MGHTEGSETHQANFTSALERTSNGIEHTVDSIGAVGLGKTSTSGNSGYEIVLVHGHPPKMPEMRLMDVVGVSRMTGGRESRSRDPGPSMREMAQNCDF